ncbi:MAG: hypothetical protein GXO79_07795 [Chlorobi bacterium]|nr:hypothetical protein [Chlorobiota bacterium]
MLKFILIPLSVIILLFGCKKKEPADELTYVPGEILITPCDSVSFIIIYNLVDSLDLNIKELNNCRYTYIGSSDSILVLKSHLDTKDYITSNGRTFSFIVSDTIAEINLTFFEINDSDVNDWINTQSTFNLTENFNLTIHRWSVLKVPKGSEQDWVDQIATYDIIESASLNHILTIN